MSTNSVLRLARSVTQGGMALALAMVIAPVHAERVKDIASVQGVRSNQLVGYGLVVGLDGTGDQTSQAPFTIQSIRNMLAEFGVMVPPNVNPQLKNVAAVSVQAELPAFAKPGQRIDVTVASIGNAKSLRGGSLIMTPMKGADGRVYAMAQGNLAVGGLGVSGRDGSRISINIPSAGRIPGGASVEREVPNAFAQGDVIQINLHSADFTTANRLAQTIDQRFGAGIARADDAASVTVQVPVGTDNRVAFLAALENLDLKPGNAPARIIVNSRTGTVVINQEVRVSPAAVTHGSLTVTIREDFGVSQPEPFGQGRTVVTPDTGIEVSQEKNRMFLFAPDVGLAEIVRAVNEVGAAPGDLVAILEALKEAGALHAELIVI